MCYKRMGIRLGTIALVCVLIAAVLCSCGENSLIQTTNYYLSTDSDLDKASYLEVLNDETMVLHNIDASELVEAEIQAFEQFNARINLTDPKTGETKEIVLAEASAEELDQYIAMRQQTFDGEKKFRVVTSGDINELYFEGETISFGEYVSESDTIIIGGKSYVAER